MPVIDNRFIGQLNITYNPHFTFDPLLNNNVISHDLPLQTNNTTNQVVSAFITGRNYS